MPVPAPYPRAPVCGPIQIAMSLTDRINAYNASIDTRIINKTEPESISLTDEGNSFKDLAALLPLFAELTDGVLSGLGLSTNNQQLTVAPGQYKVNSILFEKGDPTIFMLAAKDVTLSRYDLVYGDAGGTIGVVTGSLDSNPVLPSLPANSIEIGYVYVTPAGYAPVDIDLSGYVDKTTDQLNINGFKGFLKPLAVPNAVLSSQAVNLGQANLGFIQNQSATAQDANLWLGGNAQFNGTGWYGSNPLNLSGQQFGAVFNQQQTSGQWAAANFQMMPAPGADTPTATFYGVYAESGTSNDNHAYNVLGALGAGVRVRGGASAATGAGVIINSPFFTNRGSMASAPGALILPQNTPGVNKGYGVNQTGPLDINYMAGKLGVQVDPGAANFQVNQATTGPGVIQVTLGSGTITGFKTDFLNTFKIGDVVNVDGEVQTISAIGSATSMTSGVWAHTSLLPNPTNYPNYPCLLSASLNPTGGSFTPGPQSYVVTFNGSSGETLKSNEITVTVSGTQAVKLIWTPIPGAVSTNIYRGTTAGAENRVFTTTNYQQFIDTGTAGTSATLPVSNTAVGPTSYTLAGGIRFQVFGNGLVKAAGPVQFTGMNTGTPLYNVLVDSTGLLVTGSVPVGGGTSSLTYNVTAGTGLIGGVYNNTVSRTFALDTSYTDARYLLPATAAATYMPFTGGSFTGSVSMSGDATTALQPVTFSQFLNWNNGFAWKHSVIASTTGALPSYTTSVDFLTLTATANGAFPATDGVSIPLNEYVLVKNEAGAARTNHGGYQLTQVGDGSHPWILTRMIDSNTSARLQSATYKVREGSTQSFQVYTVNVDPIVLGTTQITFALTGGAGTYLADGTTVGLAGNVFSLNTTYTDARYLLNQSSLQTGAVFNVDHGIITGHSAYLSIIQNNLITQDWRLISGIGGVGDNSFGIFNQTSSIPAITIIGGPTITGGGEVRIGTTTNIAANGSRLWIYGGHNGANVDAMGDSSITYGDQSCFEAEGADYGVAGRQSSIAIRYWGSGAAPGTVCGISHLDSNALDFGAATNCFIRNVSTSPIILGINDTEVGRIVTNGISFTGGNGIQFSNGVLRDNYWNMTGFTVTAGSTLITQQFADTGTGTYNVSFNRTTPAFSIAQTGVTQHWLDIMAAQTLAPSLAVTGTAGTGYIDLVSQSSSATATPPSANAYLYYGSNGLTWITHAGFKRSFLGSGLTADRVYTLPDATTTLLGTDNTATVINKTLSIASNTFSGYTAGSIPSANASGNLVEYANMLLWDTITSQLVINKNATTTAPILAAGQGFYIQGADSSTVTNTVDAIAANGSLQFRRADGTAASRTAVASGVILGTIAAMAYNASYTNASAQIQFVSAESATTGLGGHILFRTTILTGAGPGTKMQLFADGSLALQNAGTFTTDASALLQLNSTTRGFLAPRMTTTQRNAIASPTEGLETYDTTLHASFVHNGTSWTQPVINGVAGSTSSPSINFGTSNTGFYASSSGRIDITFGGTNLFRFDSAANFYILSNTAPTNGGLSWGVAADVNLVRVAAAELQLGLSSATPVANIFHGANGNGTNITGADLTFSAGKGTGTGASGNLLFKFAAAGSTGASLNTYTTVASISGTTGNFDFVKLFSFGGVVGTANQIPIVNTGATAMSWVTLYTGLITGTPTIVAGTGAGTAPTVSVTTNGKQLQVTVTTGTLPTGTNAIIATVTLPTALTYTPYPVFSSANANTSLLSGASMVYMTSTGPANVTITSGTSGLPAATTYIWNISL